MYKDLSLKEKSELFKLMVSNGITDINEIEKIYNKYWDGGSVETPQQKLFNRSTIDDRPTTTNSKNIDKNNTFWEKADQFVSDAEYALTIPGLALSGITLALPNPATFIADKVVDGASMLLDGYQVGRAIYNKDWDSLATNSLEFALAAAGAKDIKNSVQGMLQSKRAYQNAITYNDKINAEHLYNLYKKKTTRGIFKEATSHAIPFIVGTINKTPEILDTKEKSDKTNITPKPIVYPYLPVEVTDTLQKTNKYDEGGNVVLPNVVVSPRNSYYTYTGKETVTPTWQEFAKAKQNEARDDAYLGMLSQGKPIVPEIPNQNTFAKLINVGMTTFGANDQDVIKVVGKEGPENVFTCINTVTGQYDDCNQVSGNITFSKSPSKYGFKEVNTPRIGDLVQFIDNTGTPHHAAMVTGFDENGEPIISYSDGGWESESMKYDKDTWKKDFEGDTWKYYTFIGNRKNASKWREEYDKKFKNKVK